MASNALPDGLDNHFTLGEDMADGCHIQQVSAGGSPMSSRIARNVVAYFNELGEDKSQTSVLSPREQQVLELLAKGAAYKTIADQLSLSIETIRMNVKHIYAKLHVHSRGEATAKFMQQSRFRSGSSPRGRDREI